MDSDCDFKTFTGVKVISLKPLIPNSMILQSSVLYIGASSPSLMNFISLSESGPQITYQHMVYNTSNTKMILRRLSAVVNSGETYIIGCIEGGTIGFASFQLISNTIPASNVYLSSLSGLCGGIIAVNSTFY